MTTLRTRSLLLAVLAVLGLAGSALTAGAASAAPARSHQDALTTVTVYHQPTAPTSVTGSGLGAVRTYFVPTAIDGVAADGQYLTGTLTTVATGLPDSMELRSADLVFVMGAPGDQLVVGGVSEYPVGAGTLAVGAKAVRPVIGGSGKYAGAVGQAITTNLGANGWLHVFRIRLPH